MAKKAKGTIGSTFARPPQMGAKPAPLKQKKPPKIPGAGYNKGNRAVMGQRPPVVGTVSNQGAAQTPSSSNISPPDFTSPPATTPEAPSPSVGGPVPPPTLPSQQASRNSALATEAAAVAEANNARYMAALRYGDPTLIARIAGETGGLAVPENPTSDLANIARSETTGLHDLGEAANQGNTFFSGIHLTNRGKIGENANFQRSDALQRYQQAETELTNQIAAAHRARQTTFDDALAQEIEAQMAKDPEATGPLGPDEGGPPPDEGDGSDGGGSGGKSGKSGKSGKGKGGKVNKPPPKKKTTATGSIGQWNATGAVGSAPPKKPPPKKKK